MRELLQACVDVAPLGPANKRQFDNNLAIENKHFLVGDESIEFFTNYIDIIGADMPLCRSGLSEPNAIDISGLEERVVKYIYAHAEKIQVFRSGVCDDYVAYLCYLLFTKPAYRQVWKSLSLVCVCILDNQFFEYRHIFLMIDAYWRKGKLCIPWRVSDGRDFFKKNVFYKEAMIVDPWLSVCSCLYAKDSLDIIKEGAKCDEEDFEKKYIKENTVIVLKNFWTGFNLI